MEHNLADHVQTGWKQHRKTILIAGAAVAGVVALSCVGTFAYVQAYEGKIYPNIHIDSIDVGGLTQEEAYQVVDARVQEMLDQGVTVTAQGETFTLDLRFSGTDDPDLVSDLIYVDVDGVVDEVYALGRSGNRWSDGGKIWFFLIDNNFVRFPRVTLLEDRLESALREKLVARGIDQLEKPGEPTHYKLVGDELVVVEGTSGQAYDVDTFFAELETSAAKFTIEPLELSLISQYIEVDQEQAESLLDEAKGVLNAAPYTLTYTSESQREYDWQLTKENLIEWIIPTWNQEEVLELSLSGESFDAFVDDVRETVDVAPTDARFAISGNLVTEFMPSRNGVSFDQEATVQALQNAWGRSDAIIEVVTQETQADITTDSVNNLGINEILGVGISNFAGSPANRIANIKHGAAKLDGILIAPGETFSLVERLKPFTIEDGYLPELVIKGDEIKPEVGGGLCQIGTTTFRATMNAGLEVVERRNHSLVVSYYNDPSNGNPGTDATIYDPAPDYKLRNNTEHYVLLTTEVDMKNYELVFTFWGTSDGRQGYYSEPQILSWSGYGETQYIETTSLAPGVEKCQSPHPGATTSFTYYVDYQDGTQHEKTYTSTYRSLPWICLVGVESLSCDPETQECEEDTSSETNEQIDEGVELDGSTQAAE